MLTLSKQSDYGLLLLGYLKNKKNYIALSKVVEKLRLPKRFLARIAARLTKEGIIESLEGKMGGYRLLRKVFNQLTLFDYFSIFEKKISFLPCSTSCLCQKKCRHKIFLREKLDKVFINSLKKIKIKNIL